MFLVSTGVASINIERTSIYSALRIPFGNFPMSCYCIFILDQSKVLDRHRSHCSSKLFIPPRAKPEAATQMCPQKKVFRKYAANLQEFIEIALQHRCSPVNLLHFFQNSFSQEHLWVATSALTSLYLGSLYTIM